MVQKMKLIVLIVTSFILLCAASIGVVYYLNSQKKETSQPDTPSNTVTIVPNLKVFLLNKTQNSVDSYQISSDYSISLLQSLKLPESCVPFAMNLLSTKRCIFILDPTNSLFYRVDINNGTMTMSNSTYEIEDSFIFSSERTSLCISPDENHVLMLSDTGLLTWQITSANDLVYGGFVTRPRIRQNSATFDPTSSYCYMINDDNGFYQYTVNSQTSVLSSEAIYQYTQDNQGTFAFIGSSLANQINTTNTIDGTRVAYAICEDGSIGKYVMNPINGQLENDVETPPIVMAGIGASYTVVHPNLKQLYVLNSTDKTVSQFSIDLSGNLTSVSGTSLVVVGNSAIGIQIDKSGRFVFVLNQDDKTMNIYSINSTTYQLKLVATPVFQDDVVEFVVMSS